MSKRLRLVLLIGCGVLVLIWITVEIVFPLEWMSLLYSHPFYPTYSAEELWNVPLATPDVLRHVPVEHASGTWFCIDVDTFRLWSPNSFDVYQEVVRSISMTIDNELVPRGNIEVSQEAILLARYDQEGNLLGQHGGAIAICHNRLQVVVGLHVATLSFTANAGTTYSYQWAFEQLS